MNRLLQRLKTSDVVALILGAIAGASWMLLVQANVAQADDCLQYVKKVSNFAAIPKDLLEDCMRTGSVQAIITAIIGSIGGGAIAVAVSDALKGPPRTETVAEQREREERERKTREREESERLDREQEARDKEYRDRKDRENKESSFDPSEDEKRKKWEKDGVVWDPRELGWRLPGPGEDPGGQRPREPEDDKTARGPTPEELADAETKKKKLDDIRKRLDDLPEDRKKWAEGIIERASKPNADGTPTGNLDDIDKAIEGFVEREKGNTTWGKIKGGVDEAIKFKEDFNAGVTKDLGEIREDVGKIVQKGIDKAADLAVDLVDAQAGDKDAQDRIDDRKKVVYDAGEKVADVVGGVVQKGIDKSADLAVDMVDAASGDKDAQDRIDDRKKAVLDAGDKVVDAAGKAWEETKGVVNDLADPRIRQETMDGTFDDLLDPKKIEDAARKVPGVGKLIDATDGKRRATDRLVDGLVGAAELAGTADTVGTVGTIAKGVGGAVVKGAGGLIDDAARVVGQNVDDLARAGKGLGDDAARVIGKNTDDAARVIGKNADDAARAGGSVADDAATAKKKPIVQKDEKRLDLGNPRALTPEEIAQAMDEVGPGLKELEKRKAKKAGLPDSLSPDVDKIDERTEELRELLRKQGVREKLVQKVDYVPVQESERTVLPGKHTVAGSVTPSVRPKVDPVTGRSIPQADLNKVEVHHPAMERWDKTTQQWVPESDLSKGRVARHEVGHSQQADRAATQAGPKGPQRTHYDAAGDVTPEGFLYNEREQYLDDLDRMLTERQKAFDAARRNPAEAQKFLDQARNANEEIKNARKMLDHYGAESPRPTGAPVTLPDGTTVPGPRAYDPAKIPEGFPGGPAAADDVTLP